MENYDGLSDNLPTTASHIYAASLSTPTEIAIIYKYLQQTIFVVSTF